MALLPVFRDPTDIGDGAKNKDKIDAALLLALEGLELEAGNWNVKAVAGRVIPAGVNQTISGFPVLPGVAPATKLTLVSTDGGNGSVVQSAANGFATGIIVRDLEIDGGRALGGWGTRTGACINISGQNDYPAGAARHGVQIINCILRDGLTQQISWNAIKGYTITGGSVSATTRPTVTAHGFDNDTVANDKKTCFGTITNMVLDAWGQESLKHENSTDIAYVGCTFNMFVSLVQDQADVYDELGRISFDRCIFNAAVNLSNLKRRRIPGSSYVNKFPTSKTCTFSGTNTVGGTVTSPGSGGGAGEYQFAVGDVGQLIGFYSGQGIGAAVINSVNSGTGAITSATVVTVFSALTLPSGTNKWVIAGTDNSGDGSVTWTNCTFGPGGIIWGQDAAANGYGLLTITSTVFSPAGNSIIVPAGVAVTKSGNLYDSLPVKRFARPSFDAKYNGSSVAGADAGGNSIGGSGVTGLSEYCARGNATLVISDGGASSAATAVGVAKTGEEVWALDGLYSATGSANRNMNCGGAGKVVLLRAESAYGAVIDGTSGGSAQCVSSSADAAGSIIWGFVAQNWSGGSGAGFAVTGGSVQIKRVKARACTASNSGGGFRVTGWTSPFSGAAVLEDYEAENCTASGGGGGGVYNSTTTGVFRRGCVRGCGATANIGGGVRNAGIGAVFDVLSMYGCTGTSGAGFAASSSCTIYNASAYGNVASTAGHDLWVNSGQTVTVSSSILYSADVSSVFPVNNGTSGNIILSSCTIQGVVSGLRFGNAVGANSFGSPLTGDPQFLDPVGGNLQLKATSPVRGAGVLRAGTWDIWNRPFTAASQGAWAA